MFFEGGNKNPQYWKDPEAFNPERFMTDGKIVKKILYFLVDESDNVLVRNWQ
ncbi:hypothetical protein C2G38_2130676 [Gigaspora rosea]|uniref:Uncharacterized protein n=1 Tax=Gigaspora rosea TaxID=44941 RepID=A0A397TRC8_9GLOM|nr:hypothetical protein C2G38_2130676 [Gigaspora rosea]